MIIKNKYFQHLIIKKYKENIIYIIPLIFYVHGYRQNFFRDKPGVQHLPNLEFHPELQRMVHPVQVSCNHF